MFLLVALFDNYETDSDETWWEDGSKAQFTSYYFGVYSGNRADSGYFCPCILTLQDQMFKKTPFFSA